MSEKKEEAADKKAAPAPRGGVNIVGLIATGVLAAAAAFGGARASGAHGAQAQHETPHEGPATDPPGYTLALEPFLVMAPDTEHHLHAMRVVLAIEFDPRAKEDTVRPFVPRIRDSALTHLRTITFETASDPNQMDHLRAELLERFRATGAMGANRVLVTDIVVQ